MRLAKALASTYSLLKLHLALKALHTLLVTFKSALYHVLQVLRFTIHLLAQFILRAQNLVCCYLANALLNQCIVKLERMHRVRSSLVLLLLSGLFILCNLG